MKPSLLLCMLFASVIFAQETRVPTTGAKSIAMKQKKIHKVTLASTLEFDRPTPRTSETAKDGEFVGESTVGNLPGLLEK